MKINLFNDDCLKVMDTLIESNIKVDSIIVDPPYGTTPLEWDKVLDYDKLIEKIPQILRITGWLIVFGNSPFYDNFMTNFLKSGKFKYSHEIIWEKGSCSNPLTANQQLLRKHEKIMVLTRSMVGEEYQKTEAYHYVKDIQNKYLNDKSIKDISQIIDNTPWATNHYFTDKKQWSLMTERCWNNLKDYIKNTFNDNIKTFKEISDIHVKQGIYHIYNPYTKQECEPKWVKGGRIKHINTHKQPKLIKTWKNYPTSVYYCEDKSGERVHPTQKPVKLLTHLIKMYTNERDTILDFTMGGGSTGIACVQNNRKFIGIELNPEYFQIAKQRIEKTQEEIENEKNSIH